MSFLKINFAITYVSFHLYRKKHSSLFGECMLMFSSNYFPPLMKIKLQYMQTKDNKLGIFRLKAKKYFSSEAKQESFLILKFMRPVVLPPDSLLSSGFLRANSVTKTQQNRLTSRTWYCKRKVSKWLFGWTHLTWFCERYRD